MKCSNCGTEYQGKFCPGCGASADDTEKQPINVGGGSVPPQQAPQIPVSQPSSQPIYKKWWFWAVLVVVAVIIIGAVAGNSQKGKENDPAPSNSVQASDPANQKTTEKETQKKADAGKETKEDLSGVSKEYTLTAGRYTAGVDIPAGVCDVVAVSGQGNLNSSNLLNGGVNALFGVEDSLGLTTDSFNGLKLPENTVLNLTSKLTIRLTYTQVDKGFTGRTYQDDKAVTLKAGNYEAGKDFEAGTYKVIAVSGLGNISSSNLLDGGINEMFGADDPTGMCNNQFLNVELPAGTTLTLTGVTVKLIPAA